ncbi:MAG: transglycosylase SLT domain-containing protein [Reinekea sp.]|jgi:soluble lytic murein transglycosylase
MRYFLYFLILTFSSLSYAKTDFIDKERQIENQDLSKEQLLSWQKDPLYSHLYQLWLSKNIQQITTAEAEQFLNNPDYQAAAWFFRTDWWNELVRREDWPTILTTFRGNKAPRWACYFLQAQAQLKQPLDQKLIEKLWMTGQSQPNHCDPFFALWIDMVEASDEWVWSRQIKAFYARNTKLVAYLNHFYKDKSYQADGAFLNRIYHDPKQIISQSYNPESIRMCELALAAVNRMAFQDPRSASNLWLAIVNVSPTMTRTEITEASRYLGIAMAKQALPEADYWLSIADPEKEDEMVQHWRLQIALTAKDFHRVLSLYQDLSSTLQNSNEWLYWSGIAQLTVDGFINDDNPLHALSKQRLYYGFLAAGILGTAPSLNAKPNYPPVDIKPLKKVPALIRAKALYDIGEITRAQVEWNLYVRKLNNAQQHAAGVLAMEWGWYAKASQAAGWSHRYDLIDLRYPTAFKHPVSYFTDLLDLPDYWIYGVMRQESLFQSSAVSPAGAHGLMQIMPATARQVSEQYNLNFSKVSDLHQPDKNIAIGSYYLSDLLKKYQHPVYATAAYNAGPHRVNAWQKRFSGDLTTWIESIPFDETRNYVKSVMAYSQIYAMTLNNGWRLSSWLTPQKAFASENH